MSGSIDKAVEALVTDRRLVHLERLGARSAVNGQLTVPLPEDISALVPNLDLWRHQAEAIDLIRSGKSTVISTGTASGKSLCFQLPAVEASLSGSTTLMVYPTKALAQDQLCTLTAWNVPDLVAATYDGDCGPEERAWVRDNANVILTNPEMLHQAILGNHRRWATFLRKIRYVVVDEMHVLRGIFGSHTAHMLRRLRRLIAHYGGAPPTFVFASATIGSPGKLASELCGTEVAVVDHDYSPRGPRTIALWDPGRTSESGRWSVNSEAAQMASEFVATGLRTLVFCSSRRSTELVAGQMRRTLDEPLSTKIRSYRAGYLVEERREIEDELREGRLAGIVATSALELGVDIGGLDAVVLCGYPGTVASFRQQTGRTGRSTEPSLAVLVSAENQLDSWMMANPEVLFRSPPEPAVVNLENPFVFVPHLGCAAHELALTQADGEFWASQLDEGVRQLVLSERVVVSESQGEPRAIWSGRGSPAPTLDIRSADRGRFKIVDRQGNEIGTVQEASLYRSAHLGAIYLHQGLAWRVEEVDLAARAIVVTPDSGETYTQARSTKDLRVISIDQRRAVDNVDAHLGSVEVSTRVTGFQVRNANSHEVLARESLDVPPSELLTRAVWYTFGEEVLNAADVRADELPGALHAVEHAAIGILPLFTICDRWDVGGISTALLADTQMPTVVIHDAYRGGSGMAELAYDIAESHLRATHEVLASCPCEDGCPRCVQSPKCGNGNDPLDKAAALRLLAATVGKEVPTRSADAEELEFVGF